MACLGLLLGGEPASAQLLSRPVALQGARLLTMDGAELKEGTIVISGDKIRTVGSDVQLPLLTKTIDVHGTTITPGLIDVYSSLGRAATKATGVASPTRRAEDAFDRYDTADILEALREGITAVYVSPHGPAGMCGTGAVIRLAHDARSSSAYGRVLAHESTLAIDLSSSSSAVARLKTLETVRKSFRDALEYRRSQEGYQEDLAEYQKKLEQKAAKKPAKKKDPRWQIVIGQRHSQPERASVGQGRIDVERRRSTEADQAASPAPRPEIRVDPPRLGSRDPGPHRGGPIERHSQCPGTGGRVLI